MGGGPGPDGRCSILTVDLRESRPSLSRKCSGSYSTDVCALVPATEASKLPARPHDLVGEAERLRAGARGRGPEPRVGLREGSSERCRQSWLAVKSWPPEEK